MSLSSAGLIIVGVAVLVAGAELLVRGAARIAARTGLSSVVIGLTVVAFGTSTPELVVSVSGALQGGEGDDIAVGNVVGSNIANIFIVLGLSAAVGGGLYVAQRIVRIDVPVMIGASVLTLIFAWSGVITRWQGVVLVALLVVYVAWMVRAARRDTATAIETEYDEALDPERLKRTPVVVDLVLFVIGLALLIAGAQALVRGATDIAESLGVSDLLIGLTVVAVGTSLPEIATSVVAAIRGQRDIAVGNAIGSNIFNILGVLGLSALVADGLPVAESAIDVDIPIMIAAAVACLPIFLNGYEVKRWEGFLFVFLYACYVGWLVFDSSDDLDADSYRTAMLAFVIPIVVITLATVWMRAHRAGAVEPGSTPV
jgi:cation:H+ antiporter